MFPRHIRHTSAIIGIMFLFIAVLVCTTSARERTDLPKHYPDIFSGQGRIDRIEGDEIVINDTLYRLSSYVIFNTPYSMNVSRSRFREGQSVYFILKEEKTIVSIWLIE